MLAAVSLFFGWSARSSPQPDGELQISHAARALQPGEAVLLAVTSPLELSRLGGTVFDRDFSGFESGEEGRWFALLGIDLNVEPGNYSVHLKGHTSEGRLLEAAYPLRVEAKEFPTRRLTVDEKFVTPPADVLDRIARESATTRRIFDQTNGDRFWEGAFGLPVPGRATSSFGSRSILNGKPRSPHSGADFRAGEGTPVKAPNHGLVVLAADHYYSGNSVILDHGLGLYSYFAHLSRFAVEVGQSVRKGTVVGYVGQTGRVTGPHLHWTVRLQGARVDPLSLIHVSELRGQFVSR